MGAVAVFYYATAKLGLLTAIPPGVATPVWPPSGIALAVILLWGYRVWPGIVLGSFLANIETLFDTNSTLSFLRPAGVTLAIGLGSAWQALVGAFLIQRFTGTHNPFIRAKDIFKFTGIEVVSCLVSPTVGVTSLLIGHFISGSLSPYTWWTWWMGDLVGVLVVVPAVLSCATPSWIVWKPRQVFETLFFLILLGALGQIVFGSWFLGAAHYPLEYVFLPFIVWAAFRFGPAGVAFSTLMVSCLAISGTIRGCGPFVRGSLNQSLILLQAYMGITSITGMALASAINERKQAENKLKVLAEDLNRSNKDLEMFASVASHDLQEPLHKIISFGGLLKGVAQSLGETEKEYVKKMQNAAVRMSNLIEDILALSKATNQPCQMEAVNLKMVVREVLDNLDLRGKELGARVELGDLSTLRVDKNQMSQLFQNLLSNALKYRKKESPLVIKIRSEVTNAAVQISVEDNGIGFEEKYIEKIFQPFERLHRQGEYEGTGIGLAICRKIAERHQGKITAQSVPSRGSIFIVTFPKDLLVDFSQD